MRSERQPPRPLPRRLCWPLALLLLGALSLPAAAQWTWRDQNGRVNASDRPPPRDIPDKEIIGRPVPPRVLAAAPVASAASAADGARSPLERELEARRRIAELEQGAKAKAEEERLSLQRGENCRRARNHQAALESGQRIARLNDKGEREILDDKGRADEMRQARDVIATECR